MSRPQQPTLVRQRSLSGKGMVQKNRQLNHLSFGNNSNSNSPGGIVTTHHHSRMYRKNGALTAKPIGDEHSYLKERRSKIRTKQRQAILGHLDKNLSSPSGTAKTSVVLDKSLSSISSIQSRGSITKKVLVRRGTNHPNHHSSSTSFGDKSLSSLGDRTTGSSHSRGSIGVVASKKKVVLRRGTNPHSPTGRKRQVARRASRLGNFFRRSNHGGNSQGSSSLDAHSVKESHGEQQERILKAVLASYPKTRCQSVSDHKQFAIAELTTSFSREVQGMPPTQLKELKQALMHRVSDNLAATATAVPKKRKLPQDVHVASGTIMEESSSTLLHNSSSSSSAPVPILKGIQPRSKIKPHPTEKERPGPPSSRILMVPQARPASNPNLLNTKKRSSKNKSSSTTDNQHNDSTDSTDPADDELSVTKGMMVLDPDGNWGTYAGTISAESHRPHGQGRMIYQQDESCYYEGEWNHGTWNGKGRHVKLNGDVYVGYFLEDVKHGMGAYSYKDRQRKFEGRFVMGQRVDGTMKYADSSIYRGQWYKGKRHGRGKYRFADGSLFKGEFTEDQIHGFGQLVWLDGSKYIGEWSHGTRHGQGKEYRADGTLRYEGLWKDNQTLQQ